MNAGKLKESLGFLGLSVAEMSQLLGVSLRSAQRWIYVESDIPSAVQRAIEAWCFLHYLGLPWRPDGYPLLNLEQGLINNQLHIHEGNTKQLPVTPLSVQMVNGWQLLFVMARVVRCAPKMALTWWLKASPINFYR